MPLFSGLGDDKKALLQKLKERQFRNVSEKMEIVDRLQEHKLFAKDVLWMLGERDEYFKEFAVDVIKKDPGSDLLRVLLSEVEKNSSAFNYIAPLIVRCNPPGLMPYLKRTIASQKVEERRLAVKLAANFSSISRFFDIYCEALGDPDENVRYHAVDKLSTEIYNPKIFELLRPLLSSEPERTRHRILSSMTKLEDPRIIEPFFERLPLEPPDLQKRMLAVLIQLAKRQDSEIEKRILPSLADEKEFTRKVAAQLLGQMPHKKQLIRNFLEYVRGLAHWLRDRAYKSFSSIAAQVADEILELMEDEDPAIRIESILLAHYIDDERIIPGVVKVLGSDVDWWIKSCAIDVLVNFKTPEVLKALQKLELDRELKWSVAAAYGTLQHPSTLSFLQNCLDENSPYMKLMALRSIARFNTPQTQKIMEEFARKTKDPYLQSELMKLYQGDPEKLEFCSRHQQLDKQQVMAELKAMGIEMEKETELFPVQDESAVEEISASLEKPPEKKSPEKPLEEKTAPAPKNRAPQRPPATKLPKFPAGERKVLKATPFAGLVRQKRKSTLAFKFPPKRKKNEDQPREE